MIIIYFSLMSLIFLFLCPLVQSLWYSFTVFLCLIFFSAPLFFPSIFSFLFFSLNYDCLGYFLIYLTLFTFILMVLRRNKINKFNKIKASFILIIFLLLLRLIFSFSVDSVISFYFFFEFSLIPTIFLIMGWGYQIERVQATIYFLIYTLFASLPLLIFLSKLEAGRGGLIFTSLQGLLDSSYPTNLFSCLLVWRSIGAFLVKLPIFIFHLWLPKAHVEAPVRGSIILAGVLLKLGGYGVIRMTVCLKSLLLNVSYFVFSLSLISITYTSLNCLRSNDLKSLIAYSSVAHMAICLCGLLTVYIFGLQGGVLILLGHGICSSGLFRYVNILYERSGSRSMNINKGLMVYMVISGTFIFFLRIFNLGAPPSINLFRELFLFTSIVCFRGKNIFILILGAFIVASYCMYLFRLRHHGKGFSLINLISPLLIVEYIILYRHVLPLFISFILINLII